MPPAPPEVSDPCLRGQNDLRFVEMPTILPLEVGEVVLNRDTTQYAVLVFFLFGGGVVLCNNHMLLLCSITTSTNKGFLGTPTPNIRTLL